MSQSHVAKVTSPLGDALIMRHLRGREELGRLFEYDLELLSADDNIKPKDLLGQSLTVHIELPGEKVRHVNGIVSRFARTGDLGRHTVYHASLRPWLWLLTRTSDCRIFQNKTGPDVIKEIFRDHGLTDFDEALSQSYRSWDYQVQYRETAFDFITRLMEQEGLYYFFKHEESKHTLILADSYSAHEDAPGYEQIPYYPPNPSERRERDHVDHWHVTGQLQPGAFVLNDFDFTRPKASLQAKLTSPNPASRPEHEMYEYPGQYSEAGDGEAYVRVRLEELQAQHELVEGQGNARGIGPGALFSLTGFPRQDQNREYLIVSTSCDLAAQDYETGTAGAGAAAAAYRCNFTAIESQTPYRLPRRTRKPTIAGPQTAVVVGKAGEEIWTDEHGRVKLQFHWDRRGQSNEDSSCWVRVAQVWAGGKWGGIHVPRIGQEVIVEFLEGDPDRPLVTGRVYNGNNKPPYDLPANPTQSGIKSRSTKGGNPDNFNEIRFEDKKGQEQLFVQAEKNHDVVVKNDESHSIGHDRTKSIKHNETVSVGVNRTESVGGNETISVGGNRTESVTGNEAIAIAGSRTEDVTGSETISIGATRTETVTLAETITIGAAQMINVVGARMLDVGVAQVTNIGAAHTVTVGGPQTVSVGGAQTTTVGGGQTVSVTGAQSESVSGSQSLSVGDAQSVQVTGDRSQDIKKADALKVGKTLVVDVADEIVIKTGDASITMKKNGDIVLKGKNISVNGSKINQKASGDIVIKGDGKVNIN